MDQMNTKQNLCDLESVHKFEELWKTTGIVRDFFNYKEKLRFKSMNIKAVIKVTLFAILKVQIDLVLNEKYKAKHFSTDIIASKDEE